MERIRVLLVDDHSIVREGLRALFVDAPDLEVVGEASDGAAAVRTARKLQPDVVVMDVMMPGMSGIDAVRQIAAESPGSRVVILTSFINEDQVRGAIEAGALGYLLKDALRDDIVGAIRSAAQGKPALTPEAQRLLMKNVKSPATPSPFAVLTDRERHVLRLLADGKSNKAIAAELHITEGTVKGHVSSILVKLEVEDRTQAALMAVRHGFQV